MSKPTKADVIQWIRENPEEAHEISCSHDLGIAIRALREECGWSDDRVRMAVESAIAAGLSIINNPTPLRCEATSPMGSRCDRQSGHPGCHHGNDGRHIEDWG